ncbi:MAG: class A beta-lactamase, partial [Enterobacteriaceae bacterium]
MFHPGLRNVAITLLFSLFTFSALANTTQITDKLTVLEKNSHGRLGVTLLNAKTGQPIVSYRDNERFPMTSTFKL